MVVFCLLTKIDNLRKKNNDTKNKDLIAWIYPLADWLDLPADWLNPPAVWLSSLDLWY